MIVRAKKRRHACFLFESHLFYALFIFCSEFCLTFPAILTLSNTAAIVPAVQEFADEYAEYGTGQYVGRKVHI